MKWYVDFSGWCEIEAKTRDEAQDKFMEYIINDRPLPSKYYDVDGVEPKAKEDTK